MGNRTTFVYFNFNLADIRLAQFVPETAEQS